MRETTVEKTHVTNVERKGGMSLKWVSPGYAGVTDRIDLYGAEAALPEVKAYVHDCVYNGHQPTDEELMKFIKQVLSKAVQFTETKCPGETPKSHQDRFHAKLRRRGFTVNVIDRT